MTHHETTTGAGADSADADPSLDQLAAEFPHWHCWRGISGLVYARRLNSSPPIVKRDENTTELRSQIRSWIEAHS